MQKNSLKFILLIILSAAFVLRIVGINYGLPMFLVGDEVSLTGGALRMLELQTVIPALHPEEFRLLYYPPLISYFYLIFMLPLLAIKYFVLGSDLSLLKQNIVLEPSSIWLVTRAVTAFFGTGTVYLAYLAGKKIFNAQTGIFTGLFVAGSFLAVQLSHFARHWAPATFFTYLTLLLGILIFHRPKRKTYIWAGLMAGIAFGASYVTIIAVTVILLAHFLSPSENEDIPDTDDPLFAKSMHVVPEKKKSPRLPRGLVRRLFHPHLWIFFGVFAVVAVIFTWLNYPEFYRIAFGEDSTISAPKSFLGLLSDLKFSFTSFLFLEPVLVVCALAGLIYMFVINKRLATMFLAFPLVYWVVLYLFLHFEPRYNLLLVPWLAILAGTFLMQLWEIKFVSGLVKFGVVLLALLPFSVSGYYNWLLVQQDTRTEAVKWIEDNISENSTIAMYAPTIELLPDRQSVNRISSSYPYLTRSKHQVLQEVADRDYPGPAYNYLNLRELNDVDFNRELKNIKSDRYSYLVVEYFDEDELPEELRSIVIDGDGFTKYQAHAYDSDLLNIHGNFHVPIWKIFDLKNLGPQVKVIQL